MAGVTETRIVGDELVEIKLAANLSLSDIHSCNIFALLCRLANNAQTKGKSAKLLIMLSITTSQFVRRGSTTKEAAKKELDTSYERIQFSFDLFKNTINIGGDMFELNIGRYENDATGSDVAAITIKPIIK